MNHEHADKWRVNIENHLKVILAIPEDDHDTLSVVVKSVVEPPRRAR